MGLTGDATHRRGFLTQYRFKAASIDE